MSQNKNQILKDIAIKLGGTVTKNDNDTNELLSIIRDNVSGGSGGADGGSKLYRHIITTRYKGNDGNEVNQVCTYYIDTNFSETLSLNDMSIFVNKYLEMYSEYFKVNTNDYKITLSHHNILRNKSTGGFHLEDHTVYIQNGRYPNDTSGTKYFKVDCQHMDTQGNGYVMTLSINMDGTSDISCNEYGDPTNAHIVKFTSLETLTDTVIPL